MYKYGKKGVETIGATINCKLLNCFVLITYNCTDYVAQWISMKLMVIS